MTEPERCDEPSKALEQVRTAYRLLNAYHRRLLDLLSVTCDAVKHRSGKLPKAYWYPTWFDRPPRGQSDVTSVWAYSYIPIQRALFLWASAESPSEGGFYFGIFHSADDALENKYDEDPNSEPDSLNLANVRESRTHFEVWAVCVAPCEVSTWDELNETIAANVETSCWYDKHVHKYAGNGSTCRFAGFKIDVAEVWTLEAAKERLIEPLLELIDQVQRAMPATRYSKRRVREN